MPTVLVTGASGGIGSAIAMAFAGAGYNVALSYHNNQSAALRLLERVKELSNGIAVRADVSNYDEVRDMTDRVCSYFSKIDTLILNAGISQRGMFIDSTPEQFDAITSVNIKGVYNCIRNVLPDMVRRGAGSIVTVSSIWGSRGAAMEALYSMTKHAVIGLTKSLAAEYKYAGIRVNSVSPGLIDTLMNSDLSPEDKQETISHIPLGRIGSPSEVADCVLWLSEAAHLNGIDLPVDGGIQV